MTSERDHKNLNLRLEGEQAEWLRRRAFEENRPQTRIIRDALALYREHVESAAVS